MREKVLILIGAILLVGILQLGFFAIPIGIPICSVIGLLYGIKHKDRLFVKCSFIALAVGIASIICTLIVVKSM